MSSRDIKTTLAQLHDELEKAPAVDDDLRRLLVEVDDDIHALLAGDGDDVGARRLRDRVESLAADFAAQHPGTGTFFRELVDALGRMGI